MDGASRLLLRCLAGDITQEVLPNLDDGKAWSLLAERAGSLGLSQFLYWQLQDRGLRLPPAVCTELRPRYWATAAHNEHQLRELGRLMGLLQNAGIPVILLKGAAFLGSIYPGPGSRPMRDVDLLIQESTFEKVAAILRGQGYNAPTRDGMGHTRAFLRRYGGELAFQSSASPWLSMDLHWQLIHHEGFRDILQIDYDGLWRRAKLAPEPHRGILLLSAEDNLLYQALHLGLHHRLCVLGMYLDLDRIIRNGEAIDWSLVCSRAAKWRMRQLTYVVLSLTRDLFASPIPLGVLHQLRPSRLRLAMLGRIVSAAGIASGTDRIGTKGERLMQMLLVDRPGDLLQILWQALWPDRDWLVLRYGPLSQGRTATCRLRHLWRMVGYGSQAVRELGGWARGRSIR